jgi:hypothetical protein
MVIKHRKKTRTSQGFLENRSGKMNTNQTQKWQGIDVYQHSGVIISLNRNKLITSNFCSIVVSNEEMISPVNARLLLKLQSIALVKQT